MTDPIEGQTVATREQAERIAKVLGCSGAHRSGEGWQPCPSPDHLRALIRLGAPGYREWKKRREQEKQAEQQEEKMVFSRKSVIQSRPPIELFTTEAAARKRARELGMRGVRKIKIGTRTYWKPWGWEPLAERPMGPIDTLPGGGLVSGQS